MCGSLEQGRLGALTPAVYWFDLVLSGESLILALVQLWLSGGTVALACQLSLHSALILFPAGFEEVSMHGQVPLEGEAGLRLCL